MLALSGCITTGAGRETGSGGIVGRLTGSGDTAVAETIIKSMDGGLIGGSIGANLSASERRLALEAEYRALERTPAGQAVKWQGSGAGVAGEVVAAQPYRVGSQDCRQYTHTVVIDGATNTTRGTEIGRASCRERV